MCICAYICTNVYIEKKNYTLFFIKNLRRYYLCVICQKLRLLVKILPFELFGR